LWHWFYFLPGSPQALLDVDGHPQRGGFMPPIPYPRRMFAGGRMRFHRPLLIGQPARREASDSRHPAEVRTLRRRLPLFPSGAASTRMAGCASRRNRTSCTANRGRRLPARACSTGRRCPRARSSRIVDADPKLLFRFSALTFNAHRIHYDRPYALAKRAIPGLVVHGPLTAVLLMELVRQQGAQPLGFSFRGLAPLFDLAPFRLL
jgi:3-methylfumaryl-CoA hydratase